MDNEHVPFKQSRIFVTPILLFITGTITAFLPDVNWWFLAINLSLCVASGVAFYFLWRRFNKQSKRYFSLMSYIMLVVMGIHTALPFLRAVYGTVSLCIGHHHCAPDDCSSPYSFRKDCVWYAETTLSLS